MSRSNIVYVSSSPYLRCHVRRLVKSLYSQAVSQYSRTALAKCGGQLRKSTHHIATQPPCRLLAGHAAQELMQRTSHQGWQRLSVLRSCQKTYQKQHTKFYYYEMWLNRKLKWWRSTKLIFLLRYLAYRELKWPRTKFRCLWFLNFERQWLNCDIYL